MRASGRALRGFTAHSRPRYCPTSGHRLFCTGLRTLENVVRELRKQGRIPGAQNSAEHSPHASQWDPSTSAGGSTIDIDAELAYGIADEDASDEAAAFQGDDDPQEYVTQGLGDNIPYAPHRSPGGRKSLIEEDPSLLSEEDLRQRVRRSIEELVPQSAASASGIDDSKPESELSPAQLFYLENRERLVSRAQQYYMDKQREARIQEESSEYIDDDWRFYHDPVVRPPKGFLWSTGEEQDGSEYGMERGWLEVVEEWPRGRIPLPDMLADLLRAEQARDVRIIDLFACGRHDVGTHGILATGITSNHCRRLGDIVSRATQLCQVPHTEAFCYAKRTDEWVVAHCGPIKVHIFTPEAREEYKLELLWERPHEFFQPGDFPHYVEIYGLASEAYETGHITVSSGSRSNALAPPPFRDTLHDTLVASEYDASKDARYVISPSLVSFDHATAPKTHGEAWPHVDLDEPPTRRAAGSPFDAPKDQEDTDDEDGGKRSQARILQDEEDTDDEDGGSSSTTWWQQPVDLVDHHEDQGRPREMGSVAADRASNANKDEHDDTPLDRL